MEATNKMIAEFMQIKNTGLSIYAPSEYKYHQSWHWLMPVIKKVKDTHNLFEGLDFEWFVQTIEDAVWNDKIELAYDAIVELIK